MLCNKKQNGKSQSPQFSTPASYEQWKLIKLKQKNIKKVMKQSDLHLPLAILAECITCPIMYMTEMCKIIVQITEQQKRIF